MSLPFEQERLQESQVSGFPFQDGSGVPLGFLVNLRLFLSGRKEVEIYLQSVSYNNSQDFEGYHLVFAEKNTGMVVMSGNVSRRDARGGSRIYKQSTLSQGPRVALLVAGPLWDDPTWGATKDPAGWTATWNAGQADIEPSLAVLGPQTLRGIFVDLSEPPIPALEDIPFGLSLKLVAGYNVEFSSQGSLKAGLGLGLGNPLSVDSGDAPLKTLNGAGPDNSGNIVLESSGCLRINIPTTNDAPVPASLMVTSDGLPCCDCASYRKVAAAITRIVTRSNDLVSQANLILQDSATAYQKARVAINTIRTAG